MTVHTARVDERTAALRLISRQLAQPERERRTSAALELIRRGDLDPAGVFVARTPHGKLQGAIVCSRLPGGGSLVWPPQVEPGTHAEAIEDQLLQHALAWLQQQGACLCQALLRRDELPSAAALQRAGLEHVTSLDYMRHFLEIPVDLCASVEQLRYDTYHDDAREILHATLLRTYERTLDFPEVNGVRSVAEIIDGHKGQGLHDPQLWLIARLDGAPVGVLLLSALPDGDGWDVAYLGIVPEARRRGLGRELALKAVYEAKLAEQPQLTISVDRRNEPARRLYQGVGFECYDEREVFLRVW